MTAKERHKKVLIEYLGNWDNDYPSRTKMAEIVGIKKHTLYDHFTPAELTEIEDEGLELRKKQSAEPRSKVYKAMVKAAKSGNVSAQKEFLDRTEGKVPDKHELTGEGGKDLFPQLSSEDEAKLSKIVK